MAGDWIKLRVDIHDQPEVVGMAARLNIDIFGVVGRLAVVWGWANRVRANGMIPHVNKNNIDMMVRKKGFADAMAFVGWLNESDEGLIIPKFDRHMSDSAKARAIDSERKRAARLSGSEPDKNRTNDGQKPDQRREEKRRENTPLSPPAGGAERVARSRRKRKQLSGVERAKAAALRVGVLEASA